jgi:hypothetical protein
MEKKELNMDENENGSSGVYYVPSFYQKRYVRIQGRELSYRTGKPKGIFAMAWRMIYDGVFSEQEAEEFKRIDQWFKENLPEPDEYKEQVCCRKR